MIKRLFDLVTAIIALVLLSPLMLTVMIILRFTGEGSVFFRQERIGKGNKPFTVTKFTTMVKGAAQQGNGGHTVNGDPRILPLGRFLRKSKIDELPQIWHIITGDMSWVGPRPLIPEQHAFYSDEFHHVTEDLAPGVTGIGSLTFRAENEVLSRAEDHEACYKNEIIPYKAELEKWYYDNHTIWMDIVMMWLTFFAVFSPSANVLRKIYPSIPYKDVKEFGKQTDGTPSNTFDEVPAQVNDFDNANQTIRAAE